MKWLDKLTEWFSEHVVKPLFEDREPLETPPLEAETPKVDPIGPIEFDRPDWEPPRPVHQGHDLNETQIEDIQEYMPDNLTENMQEWVLEMVDRLLAQGIEWDDIMDDLIFDFWDWYRENYGEAAA